LMSHASFSRPSINWCRMSAVVGSSSTLHGLGIPRQAATPRRRNDALGSGRRANGA
jgi:hypothetical protein